MSTTATTPAYFYRHQQHNRLVAVRVELSDFYGFYDIEAFAGTDRQDAAQLADAGNWKSFADYQYLEVRADGTAQILELVAGTEDNVQYITEQHPGPFRIPGCVPFTATDEYDQYDTLSAVAEEMKKQGEQYRGLVVQQGKAFRWIAFEEEFGGSGECPWYREHLELGTGPLDSYPYHSGQRATPEQGEGYGTVSLWQEPAGAQRYFVETAKRQQLIHSLEHLTLAQVKSWYQFRFIPAPKEAATPDVAAGMLTAAELLAGPEDPEGYDYDPRDDDDYQDDDDNQDSEEHAEDPADEQRDL